MRWATFTLAVVAAATLAGSIVPGAPGSLGRRGGSCGAAQARSTVTAFVAAFNKDQPRELGGLFARADEGFQWYAVNADAGPRVSDAAKNRATLLRYFADRHRHSERLLLEQFTYVGYSLGKAEFTFRLLRSADDLTPAAMYAGKGAVNCWGHGGISVWAMGAETS
jgi:pimeloyl-ACP methyl ester carboxylesterase